MSRIILFDIDYTLLDTDILKKIHFSQIKNILGVKSVTLSRLFAKYVNSLDDTCDFNPDDIIRMLSDKFKIDEEELEEVFYDNPESYRRSLYSGVSELLEALDDSTLGIYSEGSKKFQMVKISQTGISKYFSLNHIYIFRRKSLMSALAKLPQRAVVVDDNLDRIITLKKHTNLQPVWINRKNDRKGKGIKTVSSFSELSGVFDELG